MDNADQDSPPLPVAESDAAMEELAQFAEEINLGASNNNQQGGTVPDFGSMCVYGIAREMLQALDVKTELCRPILANHQPVHFFAVFDGHNGSQVSNLCKNNMQSFLEQELMKDGEENGTVPPTQERWIGVLEKAFERMDQEALDVCVCGSPRRDCGGCGVFSKNFHVGASAVVTLLTPDQVIVASCGNCRAVLYRGGTIIPLTFEHKPDRADERRRILDAGGRVIYLNQSATVMGHMHVSRALGAIHLKKFVISKPEITFTNKTNETEFIVVGSATFWNAMTPDKACQIVRRCLYQQSKCEGAVARLVSFALGQSRSRNATVIVINL